MRDPTTAATAACDDDGGQGRLSAFTLNLTRDQSVVVFVGGFNGNWAGAYVLQVQRQ